MRKVHTFENNDNGLKAVVYHDSEWDEYVVKFYHKGGKYLKPSSDYHTDSKQDAIGTAELYIKG